MGEWFRQYACLAEEIPRIKQKQACDKTSLCCSRALGRAWHLRLTVIAVMTSMSLAAGGCLSSPEAGDGASDEAEPPVDGSALDEELDGRQEGDGAADLDRDDKSDIGADGHREGDGIGDDDGIEYDGADGETVLSECCTNLADDDGDGAVDCEDIDCADDPACTPCREGPEICWDGCDNDLDCRIDGEDTDDCWCPHACSRCDCRPGPELCENFCDDDRDGRFDCEDPDCSADPHCAGCIPTAADENGSTMCTDGFDNDCDGWPDCCDEPICAFWTIGCDVRWPEKCDDGADNDFDGFPDCSDSDCACFIGCTGIIWAPEDCDNGIDDDWDGRIDGDDFDCPKACP